MMIPDLESFIPEHHIARTIDEFVESIPYEVLIAHNDSGGRAPYHPKLMLKIILYGYTQNQYVVGFDIFQRPGDTLTSNSKTNTRLS